MAAASHAALYVQVYNHGVAMPAGLSSSVASCKVVPPGPIPASQRKPAAALGPVPAPGRHATTSMLVRADSVALIAEVTSALVDRLRVTAAFASGVTRKVSQQFQGWYS